MPQNPQDNDQIVRLDFMEGPLKGQSYNLLDCEALIIGRGSQLPEMARLLTIQDKLLSRHHLRLSAGRNGLSFYLEDLDSTNGTSVNGHLLKPFHLVRLSNGDTIVAGSNSLRFVDTGGTEVKQFGRRELELAEAFKPGFVPLKRAGQPEARPESTAPPVAVVPPVVALRLDDVTGQFWIGDHLLNLTGKQFQLFYYLYRHSPKVCSYRELLEYAWSELVENGTLEATVGPSHVQQLIKEIRRKLNQLHLPLKGEEILAFNPVLRGYYLNLTPPDAISS